MKKTIFLILLIGFLWIPTIQAQTQTETPFDITLNLNTYIVTRIVISYAFTSNVTSDCFSLAKSIWQVNIAPLSTSFETSALDKFVWTLTIGYESKVYQTITIAIFSGGKAVDTMEYKAGSSMLKFKFDITSIFQPDYPTAEELADFSITLLRNELQSYVAEMRSFNDINQQNIGVQWVIVLIVFAGWIITTIGYIRRKPPKEAQ